MRENNEVRHNAGPNVVIAIPTLGRPVPLDWALAFKSMSPPINYNVDFSIIIGKEIGFARQALAEAAVKANAKYLFFLGDDVVPPPHVLRQLIYRMENIPNVDVAGAVYCTKDPVAEPLVFNGNGKGPYWDWKLGEFFEVTGLGMDCTLIRVSFLEKLEKPWFASIDKDGHVDGEAKVEAWTEDLYFCKKVTDAGGRIYCDGSLLCEHWDVFKRKAYKLPQDSLPMRQLHTVRDKKCLMLGPAIPLNDQSYEIVRCTNDGDFNADYRVDYNILPFAASEFDWVILTETLIDIPKIMPELKRVCKTEGKIAVNINPLLSKEALLLEYAGSKIDGSFLEIN